MFVQSSVTICTYEMKRQVFVLMTLLPVPGVPVPGLI
jgi:hypothetical protein